MYNIGDKVFLKISPWKDVIRFSRYRKLSLRFIGSYEVVECMGSVAYRLALSPKLASIYNVFHVSIL